jgi:hypothetical protein
MNRESWESVGAGDFAVLINPKSETKARLAVVSKYRSDSSRDVRNAFYQVLGQAEGDGEVKKAIVEVLRRFPSDNNARELVKAFDHTSDYVVMGAISDALRVRNPKGPKITVDDSKPDLENKIAEWKKWAKTLGKSEE